MPEPAKAFFVADLNAKGELHAQQEYAYADLEQLPGAADLIGQFSAGIWRDPESFDTSVPWTSAVRLRWRASAPTAGIATLRFEQELASLSLLCTGLNAQADLITLQAFQRHMLQELHDTGSEPAFDLMDLDKRPLVATINFLLPPDPREQMIVAMADRCFAASYFRYHHLV